MKRFTVIVSGASGSAYGMRLIEQLLHAGEVTVLFTKDGVGTAARELGFALPETGSREALLDFLELAPGLPLRVLAADAALDPAASDMERVDAVIVAPASMDFVATVAAGLASNGALRAAEVALKERRPLVVVPRETPLSLIHLRNLTTLAEAGAIIVPAMPAFYERPTSVDDLVSFVVGKVLDVIGVEHALFGHA